MVVISALFLCLCEAIGSVVRLVCAGDCGDGLVGYLFTCGGCGGKTAQGVDSGTSSRSGFCGGGCCCVSVCAYYTGFGERLRRHVFRSSTLTHHLWSRLGCGLCECANDSHEHQSVCVEKWEPSQALHANLPMV